MPARWLAVSTLGLAALAGATAEAAPETAVPVPAEAQDARLPPIGHVFILVLENQSYSATFGPRTAAPYLAHDLAARGALLSRYYAIGHASLGNYVALISGQAPNEATQLDCPTFSEFVARAAADAHGQLPGAGCVYPRSVPTLPDQLESAGLRWRAYMEDMGRDPLRERSTCGHVPVGATETTNIATPTDQYAAKHDPFVYFHAIIDDRRRCDSHVVNLMELPRDLASAASTPNYVFITPNLCNDGHDDPCADGRRGGAAAIDAFLREWVPLVERSAAFRADGMLIVTFDESDGAGEDGSSACCGERPLPGARFSPGFDGPGGGRVGAIVLSPFVAPGTHSAAPYNHYALLGTVEALFRLPRLGYAAEPGLRLFGTDVFTRAVPPAAVR
jgi:hypothetical protein